MVFLEFDWRISILIYCLTGAMQVESLSLLLEEVAQILQRLTLDCRFLLLRAELTTQRDYFILEHALVRLQLLHFVFKVRRLIFVLAQATLQVIQLYEVLRMILNSLLAKLFYLSFLLSDYGLFLRVHILL